MSTECIVYPSSFFPFSQQYELGEFGANCFDAPSCCAPITSYASLFTKYTSNLLLHDPSLRQAY
jgi:hypothetical protein